VIPSITGEVAMSGPDLPNKGFKVPLSGSAQANLEKQTASADLTSKFDESNIKAKLGLAKFTPPSYVFDINVDRLNVDKYFPPKGEAPPAPAGKGDPAPKPAPSAKPEADAPVDLSALKGLTAKGRLQVGALQVQHLKLANVRTEVRAANGRADIGPHSANLYDGSLAGTLTLNANGNQVAVKENLTGISVGPLLRDLAKRDALEGRGNVSLDVTGAGPTVNAIKKALNGNARVNLRDGAIKGINVGELLQKARSLTGQKSGADTDKSKKTDFSELNATFQIKNGVAHNQDLDLKSPFVRVGGAGNIDIGNSRLDYTTKASVVATTQGQGGADLSQLRGLTVPVKLVGPFDAVKYEVDYGAVAADIAKSKIGEAIGGRLGLPKSGDAAKGGEASKGGGSAVDKLRGLIGR
jgi:AsmA protein